MSQRRSDNASGGPPRGRPYADNAEPRAERSDLVDVRALAAAARADSGRVAAPNPSDISGVVVRRDSVVGARVTPPPRPAAGELPGWFWGMVGCLSVLAVGFGALWWFGRAGGWLTLGGTVALAPPSTATTSSAAGGPPSAAGIQVEPMAATVPPAAAPAPAEPRHPAAHEHASSGSHAVHATAQPAAPTADNDNDDEPSVEPKRPAAAEAPAAAQPPVHEVAALRALGVGEPSDDDNAKEQPSPRDLVDAALTALAPKVRRCFIKFQIAGRAQVRLVATPAGAAESVAVVGDFEETPTGDCVAAEVGGATLPTFTGSPLKISHTYQLR